MWATCERGENRRCGCGLVHRHRSRSANAAALRNCELIGASLGVSAFGNEEHDRRAGRAFQPRGMDGRRSLATSWLGFFYAFVAEVNGSRSELCVAATLKIGRSKRKESSLKRK